MASTASLCKNKKSTLARIRRFLSKDDHFSTSANQILMKCHNSLHSQFYSSRKEVVFTVRPDTKDDASCWRPAKVGDEFGPTWSSHLFKVEITIPSEWEGKEVHFRWNSSSEAMLLDLKGNVMQGFIPKHRESYTISRNWNPRGSQEPLEYFVQMSCNGLFGALGEGFSIDPPIPNLSYKLKMAEVAVFEPLKFKLYTDLELLLGMAEELQDDVRGFQALYTANEMINLIISDKLEDARKIAGKFFSEGNGEKVHTLVAMGHCHIDTAWLWTYDETKKKCARSWSSQIQLLKDYPEMVFTCSQMQQFAWMKEEYPSLFEDITKYVKLGQFIPVGGTWVEMDGLLPDGESMLRQFFYGQKFLEKEFGMKAKEFWLPDAFGYSGQLPQIMKHVGIERFLTQKISWNRVNTFPHHNFHWEGIDGSKVLAHFPPGDSYEMNGWVKELLKSVNNSKDKGRTNVGAYLYGLGDGGGGPTVSIIERLKRAQNVDGLPKIEFNGPDHFFSQLELDEDKLCKWVGELYLEMHNGTYTSQARIKAFNRKLEILLKTTELRLTISKFIWNIDIDPEDLHTLEACWKDLLLNQFHDVIPGSCIELVARDALNIYQNILKRLNSILMKHDVISSSEIETSDLISASAPNFVCFNPLPWAIKSVVILPVKIDTQKTPEASSYFQMGNHFPFVSPYLEFSDQPFAACVMEQDPSGYSCIAPNNLESLNHVTFTKSPDGSLGTFSNGIIRLEFSLKEAPREQLFLKGKNSEKEWKVFEDYKGTNTDPGMFYIYDDNPVCWDAWDCDDFHLETRQNLLQFVETSELENCVEIIAEGPLLACYKWSFKAKIGKHAPLRISRYTIVKAESPLLHYVTRIDWSHQSHKFLKVEFPINVLAREATYEIQYGHIKRPTHSNTSWDMAQVETSGHKWIDMSQSDRGVSLINDSKYGFRVKDNIICLSLLRSPKAPDANCDMHEHTISYAILPHYNSFQDAGTIRQAYEFNHLAHNVFRFDLLKENLADLKKPISNHIIQTSHEAIIPEVVKLGFENPEKTVCVRLYESFGGNATDVEIKTRLAVKKVVECDGLETPLPDSKEYKVATMMKLDNKNPKDGQNYSSFRADFRPFQIKSFLLTMD